ncbi:MAG: hypothetical protein HYX65_05820 [Gemmatimonadetes bacterium]|nr:hypothetical protein [Gemmatimonadota bacterium]
MPELPSSQDLLAYALCVLAVATAVQFAPRATGGWVARVEGWLAHRWAPLAAALASGVVVAWVAGWTLHPVPVYHDERAYLLQAELFARGVFAGASAPLPEFWTQLHVFVTPYLAAKYPLGTSLLLAPFAALGAPGLGPVVYGAIGGGLVFALARRAGGGVVALATLLLWMPAGPVLTIRASYMSQVVTVPLWLSAWWAMARYHGGGRAGWLVLVCVATATCVIVRPLTAMALAVPCAWVLVPLVTRRRDWPVAGAALAAGVAVLALLPIQNAVTTGDWRTSPLVTYTREVTPFDFPTFGFDSTQKMAPLPTDLDRARRSLIVPRAVHTPGNLPALIPWRLWSLAEATWQGWRLPLVVVALFGFAALGALAPAARVPAASAALLFVLHLMHAHSPVWTVFYHEAVPVLAFATAIGFVSLARRIHARRDAGAAPALATTALLLAALAALPAQVLDAAAAREGLDQLKRPQRAFLDAVAQLPDPKVIVFVKYPASFSGHRSLVGNPPDYERARAWLVYDRGLENDLLRRMAPDRVAYRYDAGYEAMEKLPPAPAIAP